MRRYIHILLLICAMPTVCFAQTDTLETILSDYFKHYNAPNYQPTGVCKLTEYNIDEEYKTISINTNDVFGAQPFTDNIVKSIYASISNALPENYRRYVCKARKPECERCGIAAACKYNSTISK